MISVLMSVYNETLDEMKQSIDSVLAQTYKDFELIVVLDKPEYTDALALLEEYAKKDARVVVKVNHENIGLAMSMNVGAEVAKGEYLLRMDADDICMPDRFQKEFDTITNGGYDFVCGNYDIIDENGVLLSGEQPYYTQRQIKLLLPHKNIIHHPTVIMRADKFREVGGYRNYKCAQDYDLWLRMQNAGYKFYMMPDKLIHYRVRQKSTTVHQRFKQMCTLSYIRTLYHNKPSMSGYSYEGYLNYLARHKAEDKEAQQDYAKNFGMYQSSKQKIKKGNIIGGVSELFSVLCKSKYYRPNIAKSFLISFVTKFVK